METASGSARRRFAVRMIPGADAACWRQPTPPQVQGSVSSSIIWICPSSPQRHSLPARIFPSRITAPPIPVPRVIITISRNAFPLPCHISPKAAIFASFSQKTEMQSRSALRSSCGLVSFQPRFAQTSTYPPDKTRPGIPIPIPAISARESPRPASVSRIEQAISSRICPPLSSILVEIAHEKRSVPSESNRPSFVEVPPRSIPIRWQFEFFCMYISLHKFSEIILISL